MDLLAGLFFSSMEAGEIMNQCAVRNCKHHHKRCAIHKQLFGGCAWQPPKQEADNRKALVHGPVKSNNRRRFF